jgi:DNA repair protein RadC
MSSKLLFIEKFFISHMLIKEMKLEDRPLQRLIRKGPQALNNVELLAIILWKLNNSSVFEKVSEIFKKYNLKTLSEASVAELKKIVKDEVKACQIVACFELARRLASYKEELRPVIEGPEDVYKIVGPEMQALKQECVKVLLLDARNRLIKVETVSLGTLNENVIHPREVFRPAIENSAASIILVHNHPSGDAEPSDSDIEITREIMKAGEIIGIRFQDHVIIGSKGFISLTNENLI